MPTVQQFDPAEPHTHNGKLTLDIERLATASSIPTTSGPKSLGSGVCLIQLFSTDSDYCAEPAY